MSLARLPAAPSKRRAEPELRLVRILLLFEITPSLTPALCKKWGRKPGLYSCAPHGEQWGIAVNKMGIMSTQIPDSRDTLRALVRSTEPSGSKRSLWVVAAVASLGSLLFGYDTGVISGALPYMYMPAGAGGLHLTALQEGLVGGLLSIGAALGAPLGGHLSDRFGRRHNILLLALIFTLGAAGCALAPNIWVLYGFRMILGFAVGGASATVPVFLSESAPTRLRGTLVAVDQFMIVAGQFLAFSMNAALAHGFGGPTLTVASDPSGTYVPGSVIPWEQAQHLVGLTASSGNGVAWRYMLILATIPAVALWIGMRLMPESSRWYAANLRIPEAIASLKRLRDSEDEVVEEISGMLALHLDEEVERALSAAASTTNTGRTHPGTPGFPSPTDEAESPFASTRGSASHTLSGASPETHLETIAAIWREPWTRRILLIGIALGLADQLTGINTAMYYLPKVLTAAGFSITDAITLAVISGGVSFLGSALNLWIVARFMRRHVGIYQETCIVLSLAALAAVFHWGIEPYQGADGSIVGAPTFAPLLVLTIISLFVFSKQSGTVSWVLLSEIFPARIRGEALGLAIGAHWLGNAAVSILFPLMMEGMGASATYLIFALLNVGTLVFYAKVVPETKGRSLEAVEQGLHSGH